MTHARTSSHVHAKAVLLSIDTYHYEGAYQKLFELAEQLRIHIPNWSGHQSCAISCCATLQKTID